MTCPNVPVLVPGSFFLTRQTGRNGRLVAAAQSLVRGASTYTHAGIVLDNGEVLEGMPGGARISPLSKITDQGPVLICDRPIREYVIQHPHLGMPGEVETWMRQRVVQFARVMRGVEYSWLDYLAIAMAEWRVPGWQLVRDRVESSQRLICSAMVDRVYMWSGIHLFNDGRVSGDVTPWDLNEYAHWPELRVISC